MSGFPGSAHDNRVYNATKLVRNPTKYFGDKFYVIGDSAFENSNTMVSAFKCPRNQQLCAEKEKFNTRLAMLRIISEHTIGIVKGRFPILKSMPMKITNNTNSLKQILKIIDYAIILHNLLLDIKNDKDVDQWLDDDDDDDVSDIDINDIDEMHIEDQNNIKDERC